MKPSQFSKTNSTSSSNSMSATMTEPRPSGMTATKPCGPCTTSDSATFSASFPQAKSVQVAGDFNNWKPEKNPMKKSADGSWQCRIPLTKGVYRYRLVVDGQWQQDPHNDWTEPNPYGGRNSVFKVE